MNNLKLNKDIITYIIQIIASSIMINISNITKNIENNNGGNS